jgi:hypothetical protein
MIIFLSIVGYLTIAGFTSGIISRYPEKLTANDFFDYPITIVAAFLWPLFLFAILVVAPAHRLGAFVTDKQIERARFRLQLREKKLFELKSAENELERELNEYTKSSTHD